MNWFEIFYRRIHIVADAEDPYHTVQQEMNEEDIVWSVLRRERIDDNEFNKACVAFDAWVSSNPTIKYSYKNKIIVYENIIII